MGNLPDQVVKLHALPSGHLNFVLFWITVGEVQDYAEKGKAIYHYNSATGQQFDSERFYLLIGASPSGKIFTQLVEKHGLRIP